MIAVGLFDSLKRALRREAADVKEAAGDLSDRLDADLTRRERDLQATPEERLQQVIGEIETSESDFDALRRRAQGAEAHADAVAELDEAVGPDDTDG